MITRAKTAAESVCTATHRKARDGLMPAMTFRHALDRAMAASGLPNPVTALYVSAGYDTAPLVFLHDGFRRQRGAWGPPMPDVYVYVDMFYPALQLNNELTYREQKRDNALVVETTSCEIFQIEGQTADGHTAALLEVAFHSDVPEEEQTYSVLRIRGRNETILEMCRTAAWSPDVYIGVCDGEGLGGNYRCENSLDPQHSPFLTFIEPPIWWVTDHFSPRNEGRSYESGDLFPVPEGFPFSLRKIALLSSRWGHAWPPLNGATSFEVRPRQ